MKRPSPRRKPHHRHAGFSLIEVLVALVVLSLGLLGAVGMQASALAANRETRNFSMAASLALDLAERMRANQETSLKTAAVNNPYLMSDLTLTPSSTIATPGTNCLTNTCTTDQLAAWDVADWQGKVKSGLPSARLVVCYDATPYGSDGKAQWACSNSGTALVVKMAWAQGTVNSAGQGDLLAASDALPLVVLPLTSGSPRGITP